MKSEKVYAVEFMTYTNCLRDTVSDYDSSSSNFNDVSYLHVGSHSFLVMERDLPKYQKYGGGFRSLTFVGNMAIDE